MNPARGLTATNWLARVSVDDRATALTENADEPRAAAHRSGTYAAISEEIITASPDERRLTPRSSAAKLRWAVRA